MFWGIKFGATLLHSNRKLNTCTHTRHAFTARSLFYIENQESTPTSNFNSTPQDPLYFSFFPSVKHFLESENLALIILNTLTYWITPPPGQVSSFHCHHPHAGFVLSLLEASHPKLEPWAPPTLCGLLLCPGPPSGSWHLRREKQKTARRLERGNIEHQHWLLKDRKRTQK